MLKQKKNIGLINPNWAMNENIKSIIPTLIISNYNYKSSAKDKYQEVLQIVRNKEGSEFLENINTYNYTIDNDLTAW